ncbi:hypothetical protein OHW91_15000 [Acinetobacter baumannii]|nr:hypothetical protein [Acinetobacter baumannii]
MDKFEEFYKQNCLDHFGYDPDLNWIFEKHEDGSYIQIEVENAKKVFLHQQAKVEELEGKLKQAYEDVDTFAEAYERECGFKSQLAKDKAELQKRVDAALKLIELWNEIAFDKTTHWTEGYEEGCYHCAAQLEQALKGDQYDEHRKKAEEAISKGASLTNHRIEL